MSDFGEIESSVLLPCLPALRRDVLSCFHNYNASSKSGRRSQPRQQEPAQLAKFSGFPCPEAAGRTAPMPQVASGSASATAAGAPPRFALSGATENQEGPFAPRRRTPFPCVRKLVQMTKQRWFRIRRPRKLQRI